MTVVLLIVSLILLAGLVLIASVAPRRSRYSRFELNRRVRTKEAGIELDERREALHTDIISVQRAVLALLLVGFAVACVGTFGWFMGCVIAFVVALEHGALAGARPIRRLGATLYNKYETRILGIVSSHQNVVRWLRTALPASERINVDSREELIHMVSESQGVVSDNEKKRIVAGLAFDGKQVHEIMTPKDIVTTTTRTEVLGPLVLDDLHKTGHSYFPVIDGDINHIVGILYVRDVLTLDTSKKHTPKVETAMSKRVYYIRQDHTLSEALSAFLSTHHHMLIVVSEARETVGILTLADTLRALLGHRSIGEFDGYDDLSSVAGRTVSQSDSPADSSDS